jgi:hypothetical protein
MNKEFALCEGRQIPIETGGIVDDLPRTFLECNEDAGLTPCAGRVNQGLQSEHRLARARASLQ